MRARAGRFVIPRDLEVEEVIADVIGGALTWRV
jgi:hypothetical protein